MRSYANFCVACCLLLLCPGGSATPLPHADCLTYSKALLRNATSALEKLGFYCSNLSVQISNRTLSVCEPKNSSCSGHGTSGFDEDACFRAIRQDLAHYTHLLPKIQNSGVTAALLGAIEDLVKNCAFPHVQENPVSPTNTLATHFDDQVRLCTALRGFHIRAVTVTRILGYVAAGDHLR